MLQCSTLVLLTLELQQSSWAAGTWHICIQSFTSLQVDFHIILTEMEGGKSVRKNYGIRWEHVGQWSIRDSWFVTYKRCRCSLTNHCCSCSFQFSAFRIVYTCPHSSWTCLFSFHRWWTGVSGLTDNSGRPFAVTWSPPGLGWAGLKRLDRETDQWTHHQLRTCLSPPLGSPSSSPSPALKAS